MIAISLRSFIKRMNRQRNRFRLIEKDFSFSNCRFEKSKIFFDQRSWIARVREIYWNLLRDWHRFFMFFVLYNSLFSIVECWLFWISRKNIQKAIKWQKSNEYRANYEIRFFDLFTSSKKWNDNRNEYNVDLSSNKWKYFDFLKIR